MRNIETKTATLAPKTGRITTKVSLHQTRRFLFRHPRTVSSRLKEKSTVSRRVKEKSTVIALFE
jgi:hypothetical protein